MGDFVLVEGDQAMFLPSFGAAVVVVQPGDLKGSGPATISGKNVCVEGDEKDVSVPGVTYFTPQYSIPGTGTLSIDALAGDQTATKATTGNKAMLLKGGQFTAKLEVQSPAQQPSSPSPVPDPTPSYSGNGMFVPTNVKVRAT